MRPLLACTALLAATPAFAGCDAPYTHDDWSHDMASVDEAISDVKLHQAAVGADAMRQQLPCLDSVAQRAHLDRFAGQMSLIYFFQGEEDASLRWAQLMDGSPAESPHPAWSEMLAAADAPMVGGPVEATIATPRGGAAHMDGAPLLAPRAAAEVPHLVQLTDRQGAVVEAYWQDGARFRPSLLGDGGSAGPSSPFPVASTAAAGGLAAIAIGLYGAAGAFVAPLADDGASQDDLLAARGRTNAAVIGAAVAGTGAIGIGLTAAVQARGVGLKLKF